MTGPPNSANAGPSLAEALFAPRGVALIGASDDETKPGARPLRFLVKHGFKGAIYPVNPNRSSIGGLTAFPDLASVPGPVDLAFVLVAAAGVEDAIAACGQKSVPVAAVLADGYAESGEAARQAHLVNSARTAGVRLLGPNSIGLVVPGTGLALSANAAVDAERLIPGRTALITQSGSLLGTLLSRVQARGLGFSKIVAVGNEADLSVGEIGDMLAGDRDTDVILLFLEAIRHGPALARFAVAAHAAGKPIIAYLLGRSDPGRAAALSHTGAIAGSDKSADAFFGAHGILRVDHLEALFEAAPLVAGRAPGVSPAGGAVAVVSTTGGGGAMVADRLGLAGVPVEGLSAPTTAHLRKAGVPVKAGRIIDVTLAGTRPQIMRAALDAALAETHVGLVLAVIGSSAQFHPELAAEAVAGYAGSGKPVAAFVVPHAPETIARLAGAGIAVFATPEACADAVAALGAWTPPRVPPELGAPPEAAAMLKRAPEGDTLDTMSGLELFAALGIETAPSVVVRSDETAPALTFDFPVAAKALGLAHKTEAGGVVLDIADEAALAAALETLAVKAVADDATRHEGTSPGAVLIQPMVAGLGEVLLGFRREPGVGPVVVLGAGGVLAELYEDVAVRLAPVDEREARAMIAEVRGLAPLRGYRNLPRGDLGALAGAVARFSQLAALPVAEAEINPLIVGEIGAVAVDALVRLEMPSG
ncbi:MAG TPA: acetate--CoA ligase family protein [Alphaproteobacteria bacterium]|nr:acetate--CoA ligase family protein [Alphaproteobacteria bacterium]